MIEIYNKNCCYSHTHDKDQFMDYVIFNNGVDVTKDYWGKKPPVDTAKNVITDSLCEPCLKVEYKLYGLEDKIKSTAYSK